MSRDIDQYYEDLSRRLMEQAQALFRDARYDDVLRVLDDIDRAIPNRPDVVAFRKLCNEKKGRRTFRAVSANEKEGGAFEVGANIWQTDDASPAPRYDTGPEALGIGTESAAVRGPIRGKEGSSMLGHWEPGQFDVAEVPDTGPEYAPRRTNTAYIAGVIGFFLFYALFILRPLFAGPEPGTIREFAGIEFVWIPEGRAYREAGLVTPGDSGRGAIGGFWISRHEITQADYFRVVDPARVESVDGGYPMVGLGPDEWLGSYLDRLNRLGKGSYRLPSASEWLHAARGGAATEFEYGADASILGDYAWFEDNADRATRAVGLKRPSKWNLFDVHGNAAEWCWRESGSVLGTAADPEAGSRDWIAMGGSAADAADLCSFTAQPPGPDSIDLQFTGVRIIREPGPSGSRQLKIIEFPSDASIGLLYSDGREVGNAQGRVTVLASERITLLPSDAGLRHANAFGALRPDDLYGLRLQQRSGVDATLRRITHLTALRELDLRDSDVTDDGLDALARFQQLEKLVLSGARIQGWRLDVLQRLPNLVELDLDNIGGVTDETLGPLEACTQLLRVSLVNTGVSERGRKRLQVALPRCWIRPEPPTADPREALEWARMDGKYSLLYHQLLIERDYRRFGYVSDQGWQEIDAYSGFSHLLPGHWVYVRPYWYVWGQVHMNADLHARIRERAPDWSPMHAVGPADTTTGESSREAWAPFPGDDAPWLSFEFDEMVRPDFLKVYTKTDTLPLRRVTAFTLEGDEVVLWNDTREIDVEQEGRSFVFRMPLEIDPGARLAASEVFRIRLHFVPPSTYGWQPALMIDAVQFGREDDAPWASGCFASSVYAPEPESGEAVSPSQANRMPANHDPAAIGVRGVYGQLSDVLNLHPAP